MTGSKRRLAAAAISVALVVASCGDGSDDGSDADADSDGGDETAAAPDVVFPGEEWATADPEELGFDPVKLEEIAGEAEEAGSNCVVVTRDGQIVGEWYWGATEPTTQSEAWSVTKSYTSSLVGLAADETDLELDDKASDYIEDWVGTDSEDITVRNLLSNDSGRTWMQTLGFDESYVQLTAANDRTEYALGLGQDVPPGSTWEYNDAAIQSLEPILEDVLDTDPASYAEEKIFEPIGAAHSDMSTDGAGNTSMYFELQSTCQDLARYGYLYLNDGVWDGEQVLPDGWVQEATAQPSQDLSSNYGYLWWLNRPGHSEMPGGGGGGTGEESATEPDFPDAPEDMYWARGLGGQIIQIDPGSRTVVTRMGPDVTSTYGSGETLRFVTEALVE